MWNSPLSFEKEISLFAKSNVKIFKYFIVEAVLVQMQCPFEVSGSLLSVNPIEWKSELTKEL